MSFSAPPPPNPTTSDDPEEDYDDLDDIIPSFTAPPPAQAPSAPSAPTLPSSTATVEDDEDLSDEAFAAELAKGMESLLLELAGGAGAAQPPTATTTSTSSVAGGEDAEARAMKEAWEKVFADALAETEGGVPPPAAPSSSKPRAGSTSGGKPEDFQKTIRETMERLKQSSAESSKPSATPDDPLAALLASLGDLGGDSGDGEGVLESMMDGLMSKEVLYEPLNELNSKYPTYLASPEALALDPPQLHAYKLQAQLVKDIVTLFDRPDFKDEDEGMKAEVRELMGKMQDLGSPPKEVMGDMPEGFELGPDGLPNLGALGGGADGEACVIC